MEILSWLYKKYYKYKIKFYLKILSNNRNKSGKFRVAHPCLLLGKGKIDISSDVKIGYYPSPDFYDTYSHIEARSINSLISIGKGTFINNHASFIADNASIYIGRNCLMGTNVEIITSDFHSLSPEFRHQNKEIKTADVIIEDNVFIGNHVSILKGTKIGTNSVIGNGSVVTGIIPANVIAAGNPAQTIRTLKND